MNEKEQLIKKYDEFMEILLKDKHFLCSDSTTISFDLGAIITEMQKLRSMLNER